MIMIIGFIGFGKVSKNLIKLIKSDEIKFITSFENRLAKSTTDYNIEVLDSYKEVCEKSDILISANSPENALNVAIEYGKYYMGIYLDLNNISPKTTKEISKHTNNFVDGAIIGKIDSDNPVIYLSDKNADKLLFLNEFLNVFKISENIGDVAILKMLRSNYTKTLSLLLIESTNLAKNHNLEKEFFDIISLTECKEFREKSLSRINNTLNNKKRKSEELLEIIDYFKDDDLEMTKLAYRKLNQ